MEALDAKIDSKVDYLRSEMNARFDQLFNFLWAIIGIFTTMMVSVFGIAFWDRKLSLAPVKRENIKTLNALKEIDIPSEKFEWLCLFKIRRRLT